MAGHCTQNKSTSGIWTAAAKAKYYESSKEMCYMGNTGTSSHKDGGAPRVAREEEAVQRIVDTVKSLVDPFETQDVITHISSGKHASPSIEKDLLAAGQIGLKAVHTFAIERLSTDGNVSFHDLIQALIKNVCDIHFEDEKN